MTDGAVLLDANVLIALVVVDHVHHDEVERWSSQHPTRFATCPSTQGSLVRFLVMAGASGDESRRVVRQVSDHDRHHFWSDSLPYGDVDLAGVVGHRQVTDAYLASLARRRGGRLATLDRGLAAMHADVADLVSSSSS